MKILKWIAIFVVISAIGFFIQNFYTHTMFALDRSMQRVVTKLSPKLPITNDYGLLLTRITYSSPTLHQYFSIPRRGDSDFHIWQLTVMTCKSEISWAFKKGFRIENTFQQEKDPNSTNLGVSKTIVIDDKYCQRYVPTITAAPDKNTPTGFAP
ncbi:MAG: hypothetical protein KGO49_05345 [Gammaproteobacteria bacterium]|nr:hypothetical protein [Gammaproteobacteria bacterium]